MQSIYKIRIYSPDGELREEVSDFLAMRCWREVNAPGELRFTLIGSHPALQALEYRSRVELWRKNTRQGLDWTCESQNLYLRREQRYSDHELFTAVCPGALWLLTSRVAAWPKRSLGHRLFTGQADQIARTLVLENAGEEALAVSGRLRDGVINGLFVEEGTPAGEILTWEVGRGDLLSELQRLARGVKNDFSLAYREAAPAGWVFRWCIPQLGADRSGAVQFNLALGTLAEPSYTLDWQAEKTVAIVAGAETQTSESYLVSQSDGFQPDHDLEAWVASPGSETEGEMESAARAYLASRKAVQELRFQVKQAPELIYGRDYWLGDLVSASYAGMTMKAQVKAVTLQLLRDGEEQIEVACAARA